MRILFFGDLLGRAGRSLLIEKLPDIKEALKPDVIIANGENAAAGFGLTQKIADDLFEAGVHVVSGGNHTFDQKDIQGALNSDPRILRPINFPAGTPGQGATIINAGQGRKVMVINAMARVFMNPLDCPFRAVDAILSRHKLGTNGLKAIFVDFHGEATSEKMAMGQYLDGRVTGVVGTHSHVPTADAQIFDKGTAYQTDAGMCGDYNSVIGMEKEEPISRFLTKMNKTRYAAAQGPATLCGVMIDADRTTGLATHIEPIRFGARLINTGL